VERGSCEKTSTVVDAFSNRPKIGMMAMPCTGLITAGAAAEQSGQKCEPAELELEVGLRSAQECNCGSKKATARNNTKTRTCHGLLGMWLIRRSLGGNGCRVKSYNGVFHSGLQQRKRRRNLKNGKGLGMNSAFRICRRGPNRRTHDRIQSGERSSPKRTRTCNRNLNRGVKGLTHLSGSAPSTECSI
jgi:hypothetical protein